MLELKNITKKFGNNIAVNNISFKVEEGKILGLLGRNGAGKSTIFRCILNIIKQDEGNITYNKQKINENITNSIGYLPEEGSLILEYTVLDQCIYYGALKLMSEDKVKKELIKWLNKFNILEYMNTKLKDLSKGNRQKIQFIISVLHSPTLLILDEPFSGLDPISVEEIKNVILELKNEGKCIVFSSHRMDYVEMLCDDIIILDKGNEVISGNLQKIKQDFRKKRLNIVGELKKSDLQDIEEIENITEVEKNNFILLISSEDVLPKILKKIGDKKILKFATLDTSLNDIFIEKVGKSYEE